MKGYGRGESRPGHFAVYLDQRPSDIKSRRGCIDMISALYVLGGSLSFALSASGAWNSNDRLEAALEGAVICGWLGALIGAIAVARNSDSQWENLGPAVAVMLLTVMYGYFVKVIVRLVLLGRSRQ